MLYGIRTLMLTECVSVFETLIKWVYTLLTLTNSTTLTNLSVGVVCTVPNRSMTGSGSALGGDEVPAAGTEAGAAAGVGAGAVVGAGDENESGQKR